MRKQSTGNLLSYETQITERTEKLKQLEKDLQQAEDEKAKLDSLLEESRATQNKLLDNINVLNIEIATVKEKIETSNTLGLSAKRIKLKTD